MIKVFVAGIDGDDVGFIAADVGSIIPVGRDIVGFIAAVLIMAVGRDVLTVFAPRHANCCLPRVGWSKQCVQTNFTATRQLALQILAPGGPGTLKRPRQ